MRLREVIPVIAALLVASPAAAQMVGNAAAGVPPAAALAFPEGARFAYVDLDKIVALSAEGRSITARLQELRSRKGAEVETRGKQVEAMQAKLASGVLNDDARRQLQREVDRARVDFQRFSQDAETEVEDAQRQMQISFGKKLFPVIGEVATEKKLWAVFSPSPLLVWHDPTLDISEEVAKRLDLAAVKP